MLNIYFAKKYPGTYNLAGGYSEKLNELRKQHRLHGNISALQFILNFFY